MSGPAEMGIIYLIISNKSKISFLQISIFYLFCEKRGQTNITPTESDVIDISISEISDFEEKY